MDFILIDVTHGIHGMDFTYTLLWNKIQCQLNLGILCLDLNPGGGADEEDDATDSLLALAKEAAPKEKVTE